MLDAATRVYDIIDHPLLQGFGRFLFPVSMRAPGPSDTLADLDDLLIWYSNVRLDTTVDVIGDMLDRRRAGEQVFYDIYTPEEKAADPSLNDTGLFFWPARGVGKGERRPFAVCCAGGGFAYVGSMHDSFPHALVISRAGFNAFAIQYRPDAQLACEDLARAISLIFAHAEELGVSTECYSLWGGSAGARMAAWMGTYGTAAFGGDDLPQAGAVIMQYTGLSTCTGQEPPTYACCGTADGIASWRTMQARLDAIASYGTPTEFHAYEGLSHGFGLGIGTVAEGWIDDAIAFWKEQMA